MDNLETVGAAGKHLSGDLYKNRHQTKNNLQTICNEKKKKKMKRWKDTGDLRVSDGLQVEELLIAKEKQKVRQCYNCFFQADFSDVIQTWLHRMMFIEKSICMSDSFMVEWMKRYFL